MYVEKYFCRVSSRCWSTGVIRDPNAIAAQRAARFCSNTCQKMRGGRHVKVKKRLRQDILRFCDFIVPFDHLRYTNNVCVSIRFVKLLHTNLTIWSSSERKFHSSVQLTLRDMLETKIHKTLVMWDIKNTRLHVKATVSFRSD